MSRPIRLSFFRDELAKTPSSIVVPWETLVRQLTSAIAAPCTLATCGQGEHALVVDGKNKGCRHKYGQAWSPAVYPPGATRKKANVAAVSALVWDLDHLTDAQLAEVAARLAPFEFVAHQTHSDRPGDRCVRVIMPLDAPVPGTDWLRFWRAARAELGLEAYTDGQVNDPSRLYFLPSRPSDGGFTPGVNAGAPVSTAGVMAKAAPPEPVEPIALPDVVDVANPEDLQAAAVQLAAAWPAKGRHTASLALAGALATHGWPEETIARFIGEVTRLAGGEPELDKRRAQAVDSIAKVQRGEQVSGWGTVAAALTRPGAADMARNKLGMIDKADAAVAALFNVEPLPEKPSHEFSYPDLSAIEMFRPAPPAASEVAAEPGSFLAHLQQARAEFLAYKGTAKDAAQNIAPLFISGAELLATKFPPTHYLIDRLIVRGGVAGLLAEAKSAKSFAALDMAMAVASGEDVFGKFRVTEPLATAYFFAEDGGPAIQGRIKAFAAGRMKDPADLVRNLHLQPRGRHIDLTNDEHVALIVASCRMIGGIKFLILDPLRDVHSGAENESDDMSEVFSRLRAIAMLLDATVLVVHHSKRAGDKELDDARPGTDARGSSAIEGAFDSIIAFRNLVHGEGTISNDVLVQLKSASGAKKFPLTLKIKDGADGLCEHLAWSTEPLEPAGAGDGSIDGLEVECLRHLLGTELRREKVPGLEEIRIATKRKSDLVRAAMIQAERSGFVLPYTVQGKKIGWTLTQAGRDFLNLASAPPPLPGPPTPAVFFPEYSR